MALATQVVVLCTLSSTQCHRFTLTIAQRADVSPVLALVATDKVEFAVRPPHDATTRQRVALVLIIIIIIIIIIIMVWLRHGGGLRLPCGRGRAARGQIGMHSSCAMCWGCAASQSPCQLMLQIRLVARHGLTIQYLRVRAKSQRDMSFRLSE